MHKRDEPGDRETEDQRRNSRNDCLEIFAKRHRSERDRRGEANRRGDPAGEKAKRRMIGTSEEIVLAARARKHGPEFAVAERATQRCNSADGPEQQYRKP